MFTNSYDNLFIWLHGDIRRMNAIQKVIGSDPLRYANEMKEWVDKKSILCRVCPDCMADLKFLPLNIEHLVTMICPKCKREFDYFTYSR